MQLRLKLPLSDERYVSERGWERAILESCPFHPEGGCGLEKLGTYGRMSPMGVRIARWWCPLQRASISLLPDFLAARFPGTLQAVEDVVASAEHARSAAAAVDVVRPPDVDDAIGLVGAQRWLRRRVTAVRTALRAIVTLMPERFAGVTDSVAGMREALGTDRVLVALREIAARRLHALPVPLGFHHRVVR